jgi:hypothetical protein
MGGTKVDKTKGVPQGVVASQLKALQDNKKFNDNVVAKYGPPSAKVEKRELVGKTHSPGKVTGLVPVVVVPCLPLPGPAAASTKPTPPPVPPKPITFVAKASPAFLAKMSATVAATAANRKTASVL